MALPKFIVDSHSVNVGKETTLSTEESHHAIRVRRLKAGQNVILMDGEGLVCQATIVAPNKNAVSVLVHSKETISLVEPNIHIAVAMPKPDKQKIMFDMLVQLGVSQVTPLITEYSATTWTDKLALKAEKIMLEACKQSENPWLPTLTKEQSIVECVDNAHHEKAEVYFGHFEIDRKVIQPKSKNILLLIGPEGGFSSSELAYFESKESDEVRSIQIGENILRTETAAVATVSALLSSFNK